MTTTQVPPAIIEVEATATLEAAQPPKRPTFTMEAYTGGELRVAGFYRPVVVDLAGLAAAPRVVVLRDHDRNQLIGQADQVAISAKDVRISGTITGDDDPAQKVISHARNGFRWPVSVGVSIRRLTSLSDGETAQINGREFTGPLHVVRAGVLREVSFVSIGADENASAQVAASQRRKGSTMEATEQIREDAAKEAERVGAILEVAAGHHDIQAKAIREKWSAEKAELEVLKASTDGAPAAHVRAAGPAEQKVLEAMMYLHLGKEKLGEQELGEQVMEAAWRRRPRHLFDIYSAAVDTSRIGRGSDKLIRAAYSTPAISTILSNVASKLSEKAYQAVRSVARRVSRMISTADFKEFTGLQLTADLKYEEVGNGGEIKHGELGESTYTGQVATYAKMISLTRQDQINDDLGKLTEVPAGLGRGAALKLEEAWAQLVLGNASSFCHADNGNLITGATSALALTGLGLAVKAMREQTDSEGYPIAVEPWGLAVPPALEAAAQSLYASVRVVAAGGDSNVKYPDTNPYAGKYEPMVSPYLSNTSVHASASDDAWYLFADPDDVAAFGIAYLDGKDAPTVEQSDMDFNTLGVQFRGYLDFGVCQIDHRGVVKADGA